MSDRNLTVVKVHRNGQTTRQTTAICCEPINDALKIHSANAPDWAYHNIAVVLHQWANRFNAEFKLGLTTPAIRLERISAQRLGTYQPGRNSFGLLNEITVNSRHLDRPLAKQLEVLLHELIHQWQRAYGKPSRSKYHNRQFQLKARMYGIVVHPRGYHLGIEPGRFTALLERHDVDTASLQAPEEEVIRVKPRGNSKMRKYACGCTIARCATMFDVTCNLCGNIFVEAPPLW